MIVKTAASVIDNKANLPIVSRTDSDIEPYKGFCAHPLEINLKPIF
ncbi:protein of unknown function [Moritella yayanosii]|uniref:Uncharacterized protein n=1 Tax=Moritella yayanosii TaxID=69539 RepID=A0A330LP32_9GAMM|nr:protein of unknown function [Moritella yayanosii]